MHSYLATASPFTVTGEILYSWYLSLSSQQYISIIISPLARVSSALHKTNNKERIKWDLEMMKTRTRLGLCLKLR